MSVAAHSMCRMGYVSEREKRADKNTAVFFRYPRPEITKEIGGKRAVQDVSNVYALLGDMIG